MFNHFQKKFFFLNQIYCGRKTFSFLFFIASLNSEYLEQSNESKYQQSMSEPCKNRVSFDLHNMNETGLNMKNYRERLSLPAIAKAIAFAGGLLHSFAEKNEDLLNFELI